MTSHPFLTPRRFIAVRLGTNTRGLVLLVVVPAAVATTVAACGGNDDDAGAAATTAPSSTTAAADQQWKKVVPGGDCKCADGSQFAFWARRADPTKVDLFLDGGGACYDAKTCAFTGFVPGEEADYDWTARERRPDARAKPRVAGLIPPDIVAAGAAGPARPHHRPARRHRTDSVRTEV
jgi:hypothetical protein